MKNNPVAKYCNIINRSARMKDRKNDYSRKQKHKGLIKD